MNKLFSPVILFLAGIGTGAIILGMMSFDQLKDKPDVVISEENRHHWYAPPLPPAIDFAGEKVPVERWEVKEQLDREVLFNYYHESNILYMLKLAGRYFPLIESRLKENGIPNDFKYLCIAESNLMNAVSRAGASGFWQFMRGTAPGYDMEISPTVDERYHVLKSTDAACSYLKKAYEKFGSWTAAAASYNCGMGGYNNQASFQGTTYYYDLLLPEETQRYIFRILAFKYLMSQSEKLGFYLPDSEKYASVPTRSVQVSASIPDLAAFARENGTTYKMLRWLNPWLRSRSLKAKPGKTYTVLLPSL
jgi:hypothetical protein